MLPTMPTSSVFAIIPQVISAFTESAGAVMNLFMRPPIIYFVALAIVGWGFTKVKALLPSNRGK